MYFSIKVDGTDESAAMLTILQEEHLNQLTLQEQDFDLGSNVPVISIENVLYRQRSVTYNKLALFVPFHPRFYIGNLVGFTGNMSVNDT
jgi:hypothetical protein